MNIASTNNPPAPLRYLTSLAERRVVTRYRKRQDAIRASAKPPFRLDYFHQVDDPHSHLVASAMSRINSTYPVDIHGHVVSPPDTMNAPEPSLLKKYALRDAEQIAPHYGLTLHKTDASAADIDRCEVELSSIPQDQFLETAASFGTLVAPNPRTAATRPTSQATREGNALRRRLGHFSSATAFFEGNWYWGMDRLYLLETLLCELCGRPPSILLFPRPSESGPVDASALTLEVFPSLRSPYTAIGFDRAMTLAKSTGVKLHIRPVLPMVMRGVPATMSKGRYILTDTAREADAYGIPFGHLYDPIGAPVRRAYSIYPWARSMHREIEFLSSFLVNVFSRGVNAATNHGLRQIVEYAGLPWNEATKHLGTNQWMVEIEENQRVLVDELGLWGVPSFRLQDTEGHSFCTWGQDRIWLVATEMKRFSSR